MAWADLGSIASINQSNAIALIKAITAATVTKFNLESCSMGICTIQELGGFF